MGDRIFFGLLRTLALIIFLVLILMFVKLSQMSLPAFEKFGWKFFITHEWDPVNDNFGALGFAFGTIVSSLLALVLSVPVSICVALFLTELAHRKIAPIFGFLIEMLAAIPSVVYGLWGIFVLAPWLKKSIQPFLGEHLGFLPFFSGPPYGVGMMAAGIILAIMITPTISSLCREVFKSIPLSQREAALGLGATRSEMIRVAVLKSSLSGITGAVMLGFGRALGETMAVTMVIGNRQDISWSLFSPAQTMASVMANEYNEAVGQIHLASLVAIGLGLFIVSLIVNSLARLIIWRLHKKFGT